MLFRYKAYSGEIQRVQARLLSAQPTPWRRLPPPLADKETRVWWEYIAADYNSKGKDP